MRSDTHAQVHTLSDPSQQSFVTWGKKERKKRLKNIYIYIFFAQQWEVFQCFCSSQPQMDWSRSYNITIIVASEYGVSQHARWQKEAAVIRFYIKKRLKCPFARLTLLCTFYLKCFTDFTLYFSQNLPMFLVRSYNYSNKTHGSAGLKWLGYNVAMFIFLVHNYLRRLNVNNSCTCAVFFVSCQIIILTNF